MEPQMSLGQQMKQQHIKNFAFSMFLVITFGCFKKNNQRYYKVTSNILILQKDGSSINLEDNYSLTRNMNLLICKLCKLDIVSKDGQTTTNCLPEFIVFKDYHDSAYFYDDNLNIKDTISKEIFYNSYLFSNINRNLEEAYLNPNNIKTYTDSETLTIKIKSTDSSKFDLYSIDSIVIKLGSNLLFESEFTIGRKIFNDKSTQVKKVEVHYNEKIDKLSLVKYKPRCEITEIGIDFQWTEKEYSKILTILK